MNRTPPSIRHSAASALVLSLLALSHSSLAQPYLFFEDFTGGLNTTTSFLECGAGAEWARVPTCPDSSSAPSPPDHARFGAAPGCSIYSTGNVTVTLLTPYVPVAGCRQLVLGYHYLLDYEESPIYDRARAALEIEGGGIVDLADNGSLPDPIANCFGFTNIGLGGLTNSSTWLENRSDLLPLSQPSDRIRIRFEGETSDDLNNNGQGFLVDDVWISCSRRGDDFQVNVLEGSGRTYNSASAGDADGNFVIVWEDSASPGDDTDRESIQARRFGPDGLPLGGQFQVNALTTDSQKRADVASDANGNFVVVWGRKIYSSFPPPFDSVWGRRFGSDGSPLGSDFQVDVTTALSPDPAVAMTSTGEFVVVWNDDSSAGSDTSYESVQAQLFDNSGARIGAQFQVNTYTTSFQGRPDVAYLPGGDFVVVWQSSGSSGTDDFGSIQGQRFAANGSLLGSEFQINTYTTNAQASPAVAVEADGDFVVVWESYGSSGTDNAYDSYASIQGQRFAADGSLLGNEFQINSYTTGAQREAAVAVGSGGEFLVVWESYGSSASDTDRRSIQGQRFAADGSPHGSEFQVNTYTINQQELPSVTWAKDHFVVTWDGESSGRSRFGIQARQLLVPGEIFVDGFESGDTSAWSSSVP